MLLTDYLSREELSFSEFARRIGTKHARTVERYAKGQAIPNRVMMPRIVEQTAGEVRPNDFFPVSSVDKP
jgi:hypothetical protein